MVTPSVQPVSYICYSLRTWASESSLPVLSVARSSTGGTSYRPSMLTWTKSLRKRRRKGDQELWTCLSRVWIRGDCGGEGGVGGVTLLQQWSVRERQRRGKTNGPTRDTALKKQNNMKIQGLQFWNGRLLRVKKNGNSGRTCEVKRNEIICQNDVNGWRMPTGEMEVLVAVVLQNPSTMLGGEGVCSRSLILLLLCIKNIYYVH